MAIEMNRNTKIVDVMTSFPIAIDHKEQAQSALKIMKENGIRHLVVTKSSKLFSVLSEREILSALSAAEGKSGKAGVLVEDVCALEPYTVDVDMPLVEVLSTMHQRHIGSTVVLKDGRIAGILTAVDCCRLLKDALVQDCTAQT